MKRSTGVVLVVIAMLVGAWHGHGRHERWLAKQRRAAKLKQAAQETAIPEPARSPASDPAPVSVPDKVPGPPPIRVAPAPPERPPIDLGSRSSSVEAAETLYRGARFGEAEFLLRAVLDGLDPAGPEGERRLYERTGPLRERCELFADLTRKLLPSPMAEGADIFELVLPGGGMQLARIVGEDEAAIRFLDIQGQVQSVTRSAVLGRRPVSAEAWRSFADDRIRRQEQAMVGSGEADPLTLAHLGNFALHLGRPDWTLAYFERALEKPQGRELLRLLAAVLDRGPGFEAAATPSLPGPPPATPASSTSSDTPDRAPSESEADPSAGPRTPDSAPSSAGVSPAFQEASAIFESALEHYRKAMPWEENHDEHLRLAGERFEDARDRFIVILEREPERTAELNELLRRCQSLLFDCIKRSRR